MMAYHHLDHEITTNATITKKKKKDNQFNELLYFVKRLKFRNEQRAEPLPLMQVIDRQAGRS